MLRGYCLDAHVLQTCNSKGHISDQKNYSECNLEVSSKIFFVSLFVNL